MKDEISNYKRKKYQNNRKIKRKDEKEKIKKGKIYFNELRLGFNIIKFRMIPTLSKK